MLTRTHVCYSSHGRPIEGRLLRWAFWLALLILLAGLGGCGGGDSGGGRDPYAKWGGMSEEEWRAQFIARQQAEAQEEAEAAKKAEEAKQAEQQKRQAALEVKKQQEERRVAAAASQPAAGQAGELPPLPLKDDLPPLPEAVRVWEEIDFYVARICGDPMLVPAVEYLGTRSAGDEDAARLLAKLLEPRALADLRDQFAPPEQMGTVVPALLIESIVKALGANDTAAARQVLRQLITGELETEDNATAAEAALGALVEHPSQEGDSVLFHLITAPEQVRLEAAGRLGPDNLRQRALELLVTGASVPLRMRIARFLIDPETPEERRAPVAAFVYEAHPDNLEAQIVLYQDEFMEPATRRELESHFGGYSTRALGTTLGWFTDRRTAAEESQFGSRVGRWLWGPQFGGLLQDRLLRIDAIEEDPEAVMLAATVPTHGVRSTLYRVLEKHWHEGPEALESAGLGTDVICEPGFLPLIKLLAREQGGRALSRSRHKITSDRQARMAEVARARQEVDKAWQATVEALLGELCRRFEAAAESRGVRGPAEPPSRALIPAGQPVGLPSDIRLSASFQLDWPQAAGGPDLPRDPIRVGYVRIEGTSTPAKLKGFFRRQFRSYTEHETERGLRLDCLQKGSIPGQQQSIDVLITRTEPEGYSLPDQEQAMVAEVLSVEIGDPQELQTSAAGSPPGAQGASSGAAFADSKF